MQFITDTGLVITGISATRMKLVDEIATENDSPNLFQMMENAGRNFAKLTIDLTGNDWRRKKILVLAGKGGNGGGGICAARHLKNRNADVALLLTEPDKLKDVPAMQNEIYLKTGGKTIPEEEIELFNPDIILDAMIGYGLNSTPNGIIKELTYFVNKSGAQVISLDVPTGINATTGEDYGCYIKPEVTLTLAYPKIGLTEKKCGDLYLGDIGIPGGVYTEAGIDYISPFDHRWVVPISSS